MTINGLRVVAVVQARLGSVRFPNKVLSPVLGRPVLEHLLERLQRSSYVDVVVLAVPESAVNDPLAILADRIGVPLYRGDESDVLKRFVDAAQSQHAQVVVRITGDCPLVDPQIVDAVIGAFAVDPTCVVSTSQDFPDGLDVEVCSFDDLERANCSAVETYDREHVMPWVKRNVCNKELKPSDLFPDIRITLDEPEDLMVIRQIFDFFKSNEFSAAAVAEFAEGHPEVFSMNDQHTRDEGSTIGSGEKLWKRAKRLIPGGNMLLSKRPEMHLPKGWPTYFSRTSGCRVWDLDDVEYLDVGFMGIGTNILGYNHPKVDEAVRNVIDKGNMSTLNCPEEVFLAEELVAIHPWADMVKFARSGGEACAVAVRIARAASGKSGVAFCGYHGWHDWYLAANVGQEGLKEHHLPGLEPAGVPAGLEGTMHPFNYNDLDGLRTALATGTIGVIFMEVQRSSPPEPGFLETVRALADAHNAVLVFDECTSGFRKNLGGLHLTFGVSPDIATFGKTLGNGYAITAVVGRASVMEAAQSTFISSTFWTERIGPTAALATLKAMRDEDAPARIDAIGVSVQKRITEVAAQAGVEVSIAGLPALTTFSFSRFDAIAAKTFIASRLVSEHVLSTAAVYASIAHGEAELEQYFDVLSRAMKELSSFDSDDDLLAALPDGVASSGFKRLA
jgi:glutamate-1-semialdehyde 2,1-aminomutase